MDKTGRIPEDKHLNPPTEEEWEDDAFGEQTDRFYEDERLDKLIKGAENAKERPEKSNKR